MTFQPTAWSGKIPLEMEWQTHSSILAWKIPMDGGASRAVVHGVTKSRSEHARIHVLDCETIIRGATKVTHQGGGLQRGESAVGGFIWGGSGRLPTLKPGG